MVLLVRRLGNLALLSFFIESYDSPPVHPPFLSQRMPFRCLWCISDESTSSTDDNVRGDAVEEAGTSTAGANGASTVVKAGDAGSLFDAYADANDPETIGVEGLKRLCGDTGIPFDGVQPLLLAWQLKQEEFGVITRENWVTYLEEMRCVARLNDATLLAQLISRRFMEQDTSPRWISGAPC